MDATIKKIPYGMTNFESIICDNYYYVDKTHYITKVENTSRFFFFVRPRRFGKSLLVSTFKSGSSEITGQTIVITMTSTRKISSTKYLANFT